MSEDGVGKFRQKKNHGNKPYERRRSFFGRVSDTVKDILSPSWLLDAVSSLKPTSGSNQQPEMLNEEQNAPSTSRFSTQSMGFSSSSLPTSYGFSNFSNHQPMSAHQQISNYSMVNALGTKETGASFKQVPFPAISEEEKPLSFNLQLNRMSDQIDSAHLPLDNFVYQQFDSKAANRSRNMDKSELATENMRETEFDSYHEIPPPFKTPGPNFKVSLFTPIRNRSGDESLNSSFGETSRLSPYYPGKTVYGGASAHRKSRFKINTTPYQAAVPMKRSTARPTRTASGAVTSSTAKKILDSLEKMSSIVQDAKKIPSYSHGNQSFAFSASSYKSKHTPYKDLGPPISRVNTPTPASHAKMRHPPEKQVSYNKPPSEMPVISRSSSGKMKREKGSHYSSKHLDEESELEVPDLPTKFTLPVQGIKLNFGVPFLKTTTTEESDLPKSPTFTFSTPIEKSSISPSKKKKVPTATLR